MPIELLVLITDMIRATCFLLAFVIFTCSFIRQKTHPHRAILLLFAIFFLSSLLGIAGGTVNTFFPAFKFASLVIKMGGTVIAIGYCGALLGIFPLDVLLEYFPSRHLDKSAALERAEEALQELKKLHSLDTQ